MSQFLKFSAAPVGLDSLREPVPARVRVALEIVSMQSTIAVNDSDYEFSKEEISVRNAALEVLRNYIVGEITAKDSPPPAPPPVFPQQAPHIQPPGWPVQFDF